MSNNINPEQFILNIYDTLIRDWNPMELSNTSEAQDAYDGYIDGILDILAEEEHASAHKIATYLVRLERDYLDLNPNPQRATASAEKIWKHFMQFAH